MSKQLPELVDQNLRMQVPPEAKQMAEAIAAEHGNSVIAVLFYGSCLRDRTAEGVLDFYVLVDDYKNFHASTLSAWANAALPPTVTYRHGKEARAKIAIISARDFAKKMQPSGADTTLWARFCQPSALLYSRDPRATRTTCEALADAITTAVVWAKRLGEGEEATSELWTGLFRHTYGAELRVEDGKDRGGMIYARSSDYFDSMLDPALVRAKGKPDQKNWGIDKQGGRSRRYRRSWARKRIQGKILNILRLVKAAFTFEQKVEYIQWKVERHTGEPLVLSDFQKNYPLLNAPVILWRLWRKGAIR